jgi:hypothetical protein
VATTKAQSVHVSTVDEVAAAAADERASEHRQRRSRAWRRVGLGLMGAVVLAAAFGLFGVKYRTVQASDGETALSVRYAAVGRPGLGVSWQIEVDRPGGFTDDVELLVDARYFDHLDENGIDPEPAETRSRGDFVVWTFDQPDGARLVVDLDARIAPTWQLRAHGSVAVLGPDSQPQVDVEFDTWSLP